MNKKTSLLVLSLLLSQTEAVKISQKNQMKSKSTIKTKSKQMPDGDVIVDIEEELLREAGGFV